MSLYKVETTNKFEKDIKLAKKRGLDMSKLFSIVQLLSEDKLLPARCRDHLLQGDYKGYHECHIEPDWLLIYEKKETIRIISLERTGTHSDLFK